MIYKVSCSNPGCHLREAWFETVGLAEMVAAAHSLRTNDNHRVEVTETKMKPEPANRGTIPPFNSDQTGKPQLEGHHD